MLSFGFSSIHQLVFFWNIDLRISTLHILTPCIAWFAPESFSMGCPFVCWPTHGTPNKRWLVILLNAQQPGCTRVFSDHVLSFSFVCTCAWSSQQATDKFFLRGRPLNGILWRLWPVFLSQLFDVDVWYTYSQRKHEPRCRKLGGKKKPQTYEFSEEEINGAYAGGSAFSDKPSKTTSSARKIKCKWCGESFSKTVAANHIIECQKENDTRVYTPRVRFTSIILLLSS